MLFENLFLSWRRKIQAIVQTVVIEEPTFTKRNQHSPVYRSAYNTRRYSIKVYCLTQLFFQLRQYFGFTTATTQTRAFFLPLSSMTPLAFSKLSNRNSFVIFILHCVPYNTNCDSLQFSEEPWLQFPKLKWLAHLDWEKFKLGNHFQNNLPQTQTYGLCDIYRVPHNYPPPP